MDTWTYGACAVDSAGNGGKSQDTPLDCGTERRAQHAHSDSPTVPVQHNTRCTSTTIAQRGQLQDIRSYENRPITGARAVATRDEQHEYSTRTRADTHQRRASGKTSTTLPSGPEPDNATSTAMEFSHNCEVSERLRGVGGFRHTKLKTQQQKTTTLQKQRRTQTEAEGRGSTATRTSSA